MPRRKEQFSGFYGAAQASIRRLRPSASGLPPFSGSGLKWALSKARPRRNAAVSSLTNGLSCERVTARPEVQISGVEALPLGPGGRAPRCAPDVPHVAHVSQATDRFDDRTIYHPFEREGAVLK